jgi:hypothetical protein
VNRISRRIIMCCLLIVAQAPMRRDLRASSAFLTRSRSRPNSRN